MFPHVRLGVQPIVGSWACLVCSSRCSSVGSSPCCPLLLACCLHSGEAGHEINRSSEKSRGLEGGKKVLFGVFNEDCSFTFPVGQLLF